MGIQTILVPTDFSANAESAFELAREVAQRFDAKIVIAHVRGLPGTSVEPTSAGLPPGVEADVAHAITNSLEAAKRKLGEDLVTATRAVQGQPFLEICALCEELGIDLVVMATHGHTGLKHLVLGSTAERVVQKAPCPVLTVRPAG